MSAHGTTIMSQLADALETDQQGQGSTADTAPLKSNTTVDLTCAATAGLIGILKRAHSGELAAAYAYRGHWKSLSRPSEINSIQKIENDEWVHRRAVGRMLEGLGAKPETLREMKLSLVGRLIGAACHFTGWFFPMYFAGRLESENTLEYAAAARYASLLGLTEYERELVLMSEVEKEHELFFLRVIAGHRLLPPVSLIFGWGRPED